MNHFEAHLEIIGINPFVSVPESILNILFHKAGKNKGTIPVNGTVNLHPYTQTLLRFKGAWRLYINTSMLKNSPKRIGEKISITIDVDTRPRIIAMPEKLKQALSENERAAQNFKKLSPSRKNEIVRYLVKLKNETTRDKNIERAINHLQGLETFAGRTPIKMPKIKE